jgi:hypothetical protein
VHRITSHYLALDQIEISQLEPQMARRKDSSWNPYNFKGMIGSCDHPPRQLFRAAGNHNYLEALIR